MIWRRPNAEDLRAHPVVRVLDEQGRTIAEGQLVAYDQARGRAAILGPLHRPGTRIWTVDATAQQIWVQA